jgi:hypothetical protein
MSEAERGATRRIELASVAVAVATLGGVARWWVRNGAGPLRWNDSADYLASAQTSWWSSDRWLGPRPVLVPAALSAVGSRLQLFIDLQLAVASVSWALLALAVAAGLSPGWRRWLSGFAVLGVSVAGPIVMWDQQVLTESLAISALVLAAAAITWAAQGLTRPRAGALILAIVVLLLTRDSLVIPVLAGSVALVAWGIWHRPPRVRLLVITGAYLGALAILAAGAATWGQRELQPLEHVYAVRVIPYPDRLEWFAAHGMPDANHLRVAPVVADAHKAPYVPLAPDEWPRWRRWLARDGRATYARYVASHPAYLVAEPRHRPERVFNNGDGLRTYRPLVLRSIPLVTGMFWPSVPITLVIAAFAFVGATWRDLAHSPLSIAGLVLMATAVPHALAVWHGDGMESARHLLIPGVQLRAGTLLLVLALVDRSETQAVGRRTPAEPCGSVGNPLEGAGSPE